MCGERVRERACLTGLVLDGAYRIDAAIAEGTTAMIYRACYLPSGLVVAVKVLHAELAHDPIAVARFQRESRALLRLRDPRTVAAHDHGTTPDGLHYLVLELVTGESLEARLRARASLPWREAAAILRAICHGLAEAHAHGIVHRSLTPANIRLGASGAVKLLDFGRAKLRPDDPDDDLERGGGALDRLRYTAPEQFAGRTCDARADVFALGVIGAEMVADGASAEFEELLERCRADEPADRPSADELGTAIDRLLAPATARPRFAHTSAFELQPPRIVIGVTSPGGSEPTRRRADRWKSWTVAALACVVGFGTGVAGCL